MGATPALTEEAGAATRRVSRVFLLKALQYPFLALFIVLVPRLLGPEAYGQYALFTSALAILISLTDLGLTETFGRFVPEVEEREGSEGVARLASGMLVVKALLSVAAAAVLLAALGLAAGEPVPLAHVALLLATLFVADLASTPYALVFGQNRLERYAAGDPLRKALGLALLLALFQLYGLLGALVSVLAVEVCLAVLYFGWTRRWFRARHLRVDAAFLRPYLAFGLLFYLAYGLSTAWQRLGSPIIAYLVGDPREVALFEMPNQLLAISIGFTLVLTSALIPLFTRLVLTGSEAKVALWSAAMAKYGAIFCTLVFWGFVFTGRELIPVLIGPEYAPIFPNAVVLLLATVPVLFAQLGFVLSVVYKRPASYCAALVVALAAFLAAAFALVPREGALGAALAMLASSVVLAAVLVARFREQLAPAVAAGLKALAPAVLFLPPALLPAPPATRALLVAAAAVLYLLAMFKSGALSVRELRGILHALAPGAGPPARA